ncbi:MAG: hypothetical protein AUG44_15920 [Actinobacteria bacterium 13_1_20CM_3_71_11]|nr:MAG: hypothetical protein AUG44_15920 [Actinobacteria bacterium 13_1_20CM_3_71_11]
MSTAPETWVRLDLSDVDTDPERLEEDFRDLLDELAQLNGTEVDRPEEDDAPDGARSWGGVELGAALIALGSSGATLPMLVGLLRDWLGRRGSGTIHLKLGSDEVRMDHVPTETQREVLAEFLRRHRV